MSLQNKYVVAIGPNDLDRYFKCSQPLIVGSKCVVEYLSESPGGFIANSACMLSNLGTHTYLFDCIGNTQSGFKIIEDLKSYNINLDGIETGDYENYIVDIYLSENDRTCLIHNTKRPKLTINDKQRNILKKASFIYSAFPSYKNIPNYKVLTNELIANGTQFMFDLERTTFDSLEKDKFLFDISSILSINKNAFLHLLNTSGEESINYLLSDNKRILLLTDGEYGTTVKKGSESFHVPAFKVAVKDATGAGDAFNGAFLYSYLETNNLKYSAIFASAAAALAVTEVGSRSKNITKQKIIDFLKKENT